MVRESENGVGGRWRGELGVGSCMGLLKIKKSVVKDGEA